MPSDADADDATVVATERERERERTRGGGDSGDASSPNSGASSTSPATTDGVNVADSSAPAPAPARGGVRTNRNLTDNERLAVLHILLQHQTAPGKLHRTATRKAADAMGVTPATCRRVWKRYRETVSDDCPGGDVSNNRKKNCGRKPARALEEVVEKIRSVPFGQRGSLRSLSEATGIPRTSLWKLLKDGKLRRVDTGLTEIVAIR